MTDAVPNPDDAARFRKALGRFATGVTVITTRTEDGKLEGVTSNSFASVSLDPPLVLWSLRRQAPSLPSFVAAGRFAVNILAATQVALSRHFATPSANKFEGVAHEAGPHGCPLLADCLARFECITERLVEAGDHLIFIGRVERHMHQDGVPLLYSAGGYGTPAALPA